MVQSKMKKGTGVREIQYSDDKMNFISCAEMNMSDGIFQATWDKSIGAHQYWRYY